MSLCFTAPSRETDAIKCYIRCYYTTFDDGRLRTACSACCSSCLRPVCCPFLAPHPAMIMCKPRKVTSQQISKKATPTAVPPYEIEWNPAPFKNTAAQARPLQTPPPRCACACCSAPTRTPNLASRSWTRTPSQSSTTRVRGAFKFAACTQNAALHPLHRRPFPHRPRQVASTPGATLIFTRPPPFDRRAPQQTANWLQQRTL